MRQKKAEAPQQTQDAANNHKRLKRFTINLSLLLSGIAMSTSGLIIQIHYHLRHKPDELTVLSLGRVAWNSVHIWTSVTFSLIVLYHIRNHWKWYKHAFKQIGSSRNRPTIVLTFLTLITAISGYIPLLIKLSENNSPFRLSVIEIHDKIALPFLVIVFFHTLKRIKINSFHPFS